MTASGGIPVEPLLERADELTAIDDVLAAAVRGEARPVIVEGPAGIGKTALLEAATVAAERAGLRVLRARGGELEQEVGFAVVGQLFGAALSDQGTELAGPARRAAEVLGVSAVPEPRLPGDETIVATLQALYWLTVNLAEGGALALLIDDAQLADSASIRYIAYLAQRMEGVPVAPILAMRNGHNSQLVHRALPQAQLIHLAPLSAEATAALVRGLVPHADDATCRACHEATGGNAFFVRELVGELAREPGEVDAAARVANRSPERVTRSIASRLDALPAGARELAHAIAVLGNEPPLRHAAMLARVDLAAAAEVADALRAAAIVASGQALEFVHPIVRSAVYDELAPGARSVQHARAAALLLEEHAPPEHVAAHLLRSEPSGDPRLCECLQRAARSAMAHGAPDQARDYLQRALREPPSAEQRPGVLLELALVEVSLLAVEDAATRLRLAFDLAPDGMARLLAARVAALIATQGTSVDAAIELLERVRAEFAAEPDVVTALDADIANVARFEMQARRRTLAVSLRLRELAVDEHLADPGVLASIAAELAMTGDSRARLVALARRGIEAARTQRSLGGAFPGTVLARSLMIADELGDALRVLDELLADARGRGSVLDFALISVFRSDAMYRLGDVYEAVEDARTAYSLVSEHGWPMGVPAIVSQITHGLIERGELQEARALLEQTKLLLPPRELPSIYTSNLLLWARGRLRVAEGATSSGLEDLLECGRREDAWEELNPAVVAWRSDAAVALAKLGRADEAVLLAREEVRLARRFGAPRALGSALRASGVVGDGAEALALAREAVDVLAGSPARLEHARALVDLGERLLAEGKRGETRSLLAEAFDLAHVCGAFALEARALEGLRATGARPRRPRLSGPDALTPRERRVAQMAANSMSNREIAESLFVTVRTVEFHLGRAYKKLAIDSRHGLTAALRAEGAKRPGRPSRSSG